MKPAPDGDLGEAPAHWRGFIPRSFPRAPRPLRIVLAGLGIAYAALVTTLICLPTNALVDESRSLASFDFEPGSRILVEVEGNVHSRDIMRWIFLGRRDALQACVPDGRGVQFRARFDDRAIRVDAPGADCLQRAMDPVRTGGDLEGNHLVTLTKVWPPGLASQFSKFGDAVEAPR